MKEKIEHAITNFVKGGDNSETILLEKVLNKDFRVTNNDFMGTSGVTIIYKQKYLSYLKDGTSGGLPRIKKIESMDNNETIAMIKLRLESSKNAFI